MKRRAFVAVLAALVAVAALVALAACARPNAAPVPVEGAPPRAADEASPPVDASSDGRMPGLPMPQQFPHVVWDAAGAPSGGR